MTDPNTATIRQLVDDCRERLEKELCELVDELVPALVEDARVQCSAGRDESLRMTYVGLQVNLEARLKQLSGALRGTLAKRVELAAQRGQGAESLQILSDEQASAQLAMREILDEVDAACREETNALERRIAHLVLRNVLARGDNAFNVASLLESLDGACAKIFSDSTQRMAVMRLLGGQLASELPSLFRAINETLIDADILPRLKRSDSEAAPVDPGVAAAESARMMGTIEKLAKARSSSAGGAAPDNGAGSKAFLAALNTLQVVPTTSAPGAHTNVVRMARDSDAARNVRAADAVTLDIFAEVFDLIFGDENVSEGIKTLVGRLQTPVLKVAMANQRFFADRTHPVRRFLDSISAVAIRWGKSVDASDPFYRKLSELIERIQQTPDGDVGVFDAANSELSAFLAERERIEAEENRQLAEAVRAREEEIRIQREGQLRAQKAADQLLAPLLKSDLPAAIEQFLMSYWRDVLQGRIFSAGAESPAAADAVQVATDLLASVTPKFTAEERQRQTAALPVLLKRLNAGFDELSASPTERTAFMDALVEMCLAALRGESRASNDAAHKATKRAMTRKHAATLQVSHATPTGVRVQDISLAGDGGDTGEAPAAADKGDLRRVRQLVRGDWVDFINAGQTRRERLTWINRSRSLFLFSNHTAACAISITPEALAVRLTNRTAQLVKRDAPIFERALKGAVQTVDKRG